MNKKLLLILFAIGVIVFGVVIFFVVKAKGGSSDIDDVAVEIPFAQRPIASLTPSEDGYWLKLIIDKVEVAKAESLDYELLYSLPDGRTQGVPGTVKLDGSTSIERDLLLGSESSGKFRYDEGVEEGSLTIRFRDSKGKLLAKFATKWHLQTATDELTSVDNVFSYKLDEESDSWFVTMETFGLPQTEGTGLPGSVSSGPYGIFSSIDLPTGTADGWQVVTSNLFYR